MAEGWMPFLSTLQYSITPAPRLSRSFDNLKITILLVIAPKANNRFGVQLDNTRLFQPVMTEESAND
jgi:hypothetical protein